VEEHSVDLLLQGGNHSEELLLSGEGWALKMFSLVAVVVGTCCVVVVVMVMGMIHTQSL